MYQALMAGGLILCIVQPFIGSTPNLTAKAVLHENSLKTPADNENIPAQEFTYYPIVKVADEENNVEALFEEAQYDFDAGDHGVAKRRFAFIVEKFPTSKSAAKAQRYLAIIDKLGVSAVRDTPKAEDNLKKDNSKAEIIRHETHGPNSDKSSRSTTVAAMRDDYRRDFTRQRHDKAKKAEIMFDPARQHEFLMAVGDRVFFSSGSAEIDNRARVSLQRQANWLSKDANIGIRVIGHAFEMQTASDDKKLSWQRAAAVRDWLISYGISAKFIEIVALGRAERIANCEEAICQAQNRRVIIQILTSKSQENPSPPANRRM